jgi:hypothetical protein
MRVGDSSMGGDAGQFHTTRWTLKAFVGMGKSGPEASNEEAAKALDVGLSTVKTVIHRLRKQYLVVVRKEVARTLSDPAENEGEICVLWDALIAAEGRVRP